MAYGNFNRCFDLVIDGESHKYSTDARDPGNWHNGHLIGSRWGVSASTAANWFGQYGQHVTAKMMQELPKNTARIIYHTKFWNPLRCEYLPIGLDLLVFDFGVNEGIYESALMLQRALDFSHQYLDGAIDNLTIAAATQARTTDLIYKLSRMQEHHYRSLPKFPIFGHGWLIRQHRILKEALNMIS